MAGYWLLVLHMFGDYILQSDWMATDKTKQSWPALAHALTYTLPFLLLFGFQWQPLLLIGGTHFIIDRWRLARYVCWAKNQVLGPRETADCTAEYVFHNGRVFNRGEVTIGQIVTSDGKHYRVLAPVAEDESLRTQPLTLWRRPWAECQGTGYPPDKPAWLAVWLLIVADNTLHLVFNGLAWHWWGTV